MVLRNRSWPGTSTMGTSLPSLNGMNVNPRSIVIPRIFFLLQAVWMDSRQGFHQGALAVVDVTCRADGKMGHGWAGWLCVG